jgi:hypothetical protein
MQIAIAAMAIWGLYGLMAAGQPAQDLRPPGSGVAMRATVNSQQSLADAVGAEFQGETWEHPSGLLAREFPGFTYVSGPYDKELSGKAQWRKPVILKNKTSGMELAINCYRHRPPPPPRPKPATEKEKSLIAGSPSMPLDEPNYPYKPIEFHQLRAATAGSGGHEAFVFRDGDLLFKIEVTGGKTEDRQKAAAAAAEAIWKFRQTKEKAPAGQAAPPWDAPPPRDLPTPPHWGPMGMGGGMGNDVAPQDPGFGGMSAPQPMEK